ncbi:flagellin lysine-N-methylase [Cohnella soli]|uniref:Flagellin lysine-N-methylase n=1 Tax=Cohnella soli TaxID=425005 RepID=A0ABW0HX42_9BACL
MNVLLPEYYDHFKCIGEDCEDTCCAGWNISIDTETKKKYKSVPTNVIDLQSGIVKDSFKQHEGVCHFLHNNLCRIQLTLGESYLSNTCSTFPRQYKQVDDILELSASPACPEIARLALMNRDGISFQTDTRDVIAMGKMKLNATDEFYTLRALTIGVLQDRRYSISDRLIILTMYFTQKEVYSGDEQQFLNNDFSDVLKKIRPESENQFKLISELIHFLRDEKKDRIRYKECYDEMSTYLNGSFSNYEQAYHDFYKPFMEENEFILENYLVNYAFRNLDYKSLDQFYLMCVYFAVIKYHLIGLAGSRKGLDTDLVIKQIQSFVKRFEHHPATYTVIKHLHKKEFASLRGFVLILKN